MRDSMTMARRLCAGASLLLVAGQAAAADNWRRPKSSAPVEFGGSVSVLWPVPESGDLESTGPGTGLTLGAGYRFQPNWTAELNVISLDREYETPEWIRNFWGGVDEGMSLETRGLELGLRAMHTTRRWELFAGVGAGYYRSEMAVSGDLLGYPVDIENEKDSAAGYRVSLGADLVLRHVRLGLEYRYLFLRGDFGELSGGDVDIGGQQTAFRLLYVWDSPRFRSRRSERIWTPL